MKKITISITAVLLTLLSSCAIGGSVEADDIRGTWVSAETYYSGNSSVYVYYDFRPTDVDAFDGDHSGNYSIRKYNSSDYGGSNYTVVEEGRYETDYFSGTIELRNSVTRETRELDYDLTNNDLYLTDYGFWFSSTLHLKKLY